MGFNMRQGGRLLGKGIWGTSLMSLPAAARALPDSIQGAAHPAPELTFRHQLQARSWKGTATTS